MEFEKTKKIKLLLNQGNALSRIIKTTLSDTSDVVGRYNSCVEYAKSYNKLLKRSYDILDNFEDLVFYKLKDLSPYNMTWPQQKTLMESVLTNLEFLLSNLSSSLEFVEDEFNNLENFIRTKLRSALFSFPEKEIDIQNALESLFIGRGWSKGIDYDREAGKFNFSGREYIPDFIIPNLRLAIEVKLIRKGRKSKIIEEINADVSAYSKQYSKQMYIIYDLGEIRDEIEFRRDIELLDDDIRVLVIKH